MDTDTSSPATRQVRRRRLPPPYEVQLALSELYGVSDALDAACEWLWSLFTTERDHTAMAWHSTLRIALADCRQAIRDLQGGGA